MRIFVTGARGAIGRALIGRLLREGHAVVAATRHPETYTGAGEVVALDLDDPGPMPTTTRDALAGCDAAFFLVHALDLADFEAIDRRRAERFADEWGARRRLVYLGGLGPDGPRSSSHLRSRHEVGAILGRHCDTVELRASIVLGPDSTSFRLLRRLGHLAGLSPLPLLVPRAAATLTQPIAQRDLTDALVAALELAAGVYDVGGPDVLSFADLLERSAAAQGRRLRVRPHMWIGPEWAGPGAALLADVDPRTATALLASMGTRTVVRRGHELPGPHRPTTPVDLAIQVALTEAA